MVAATSGEHDHVADTAQAASDAGVAPLEHAPDAGSARDVGKRASREDEARIPPSDIDASIAHGRGADKPWLALGAFEGPLDLLYDMARAQKVSLEKVSILALVEQYLAFMEHARLVRIELAADWLVMAAWLTWLKSKLLLPQEDAEQDSAEAAAQLHARLEELEAVRNAAAWLAARSILGESVFPRGLTEDFTQVDRSGIEVDLPTLLSAYLRVSRRGHRKKTYAPRVAQYWTIGDAMQALQRMLNTMHVGHWCALEDILVFKGAATPFTFKAALSGALSACLELAKAGSLTLDQLSPFDTVRFTAIAPETARS